MGGATAHLNDVLLSPMPEIGGHRGSVLHVMTTSSAGYHGFGEAYFSTVEFGAIKGWKRHRRMVCNLVVPIGEVRFVLFDDRTDSPTYGRFEEAVLSRSNYQRLTIPPSVWFAFEGRSDGVNMILNVASIPHDPGEQVNLPLQNDVIPHYAF